MRVIGKNFCAPKKSGYTYTNQTVRKVMDERNSDPVQEMELDSKYNTPSFGMFHFFFLDIIIMNKL